MDAKIQIADSYIRSGYKFYPKTINKAALMLCTRRNISAKKPPFYLMIEQGKEFRFLSSLYSVGQNRFILDYKGQNFMMQIDDFEAEIMSIK
jgi:hypothetical protein